MIQSSSSSNSSSFRSDVSSPGQPIGAPSSSSKAGQFKTLFQIIEDEECCRMLQGWIESRGKSTITNEMERFISDCQGLNGFPALFHAFLHSQIQLFLAPTRSLSTTAINDSSSSTHLSSISLGTSASGGATQTSAEDIGTIAKKSDDHAVPLTLGGLPITVRKTQQQSKAKKRVNPIAVLAAPIVASVQTSQSASQKESHPSAPTSGNISSLPSSSPIGTNPTTAPSATLDSETPDCPAGLDRLASVYARLVMQQYLPLTANVLLLAKMLAVATEDSPLSRSITNSSSLPLFANTNFSRMPSFIHSSFHLHAFAVRAIESLKPLIHCLGPNLMQGLSDNTAIRHHNPAFASELTAVCEEVTGVGKEEALIVPSVFIRTFREDVDSRHEVRFLSSTSASPLSLGSFTHSLTCLLTLSPSTSQPTSARPTMKENAVSTIFLIYFIRIWTYHGTILMEAAVETFSSGCCPLQGLDCWPSRTAIICGLRTFSRECSCSMHGRASLPSLKAHERVLEGLVMVGAR